MSRAAITPPPKVSMSKMTIWAFFSRQVRAFRRMALAVLDVIGSRIGMMKAFVIFSGSGGCATLGLLNQPSSTSMRSYSVRADAGRVVFGRVVLTGRAGLVCGVRERANFAHFPTSATGWTWSLISADLAAG